MSTNLRTATSPRDDVEDTHVTAYSGGERGRMLQMHQQVGSNMQAIHMDEDQVRELMHTMQEWLGG